MSLFSDRVQSTALAACLTFAIGAPAANASVDLQFKWWIDGSVAGSYSVTGTALGNGMFNYSGTLFYLNPFNPFEVVNLSYNLNGKPDVNSGVSNNVLLSGNLAVENLFTNTIDVQLLVELPVANSLLPSSNMGGSAAIGLTTNDDGGSLASVGVPVWRALTDGTPVGAAASLFFDPFALTNSGFGSNSTSGNFGIPIPIVGGPIVNSMGIDINFSLTPSDQASITSVVNAVPIPGPGALALLGAAGLVTRRRRR